MFGKKKVTAPAKIIADEGYGFVDKSASKTLQHEKYIVEVHPENEPAFRAEVTAWVAWPEMPQPGDQVQVRYKPGTHDVDLDITGDPRFDWKLLETQRKTEDAATRERLLNEPPSPDLSSGPGDDPDH